MFLDAPAGKVFAVHHRPSPPMPCRGTVLCVLPFNEEMNRCRSMVTLQAQAFATLGLATLVADLHGTGDSAGEFRDGRWDIWMQDLECCHAWAEAQPGGCVALWGIRLGVPIAVDALRRFPAFPRVLMAWQPVVDGAQYVTQFLRIRIAAAMDRNDQPKETTKGLREFLARGECVEVGGYELHPALAAAIDRVHLKKSPPPAGTQAWWLEQAAPGSDELSPVSSSTLAAWREAGIDAADARFDGPAFWQLHERAVAPEAIGLTTEFAARRWGQP